MVQWGHLLPTATALRPDAEPACCSLPGLPAQNSFSATALFQQLFFNSIFSTAFLQQLFFNSFSSTAFFPIINNPIRFVYGSSSTFAFKRYFCAKLTKPQVY
jgi:hypothetical protein